MAKQCPFCDEQNMQRLRLWQTEWSWVACNRYPITPIGHFLVVPRKHIVTLSALGAVEAADLFLCLTRLTSIVRRELGHDYNVVLNDGPSANQTIEHIHLNVVCRQKGDNIINFQRNDGTKRSEVDHSEVERLRLIFR